MLNFLGTTSLILFFFLIMLVIVVFTSFKTTIDPNGNKVLSLFWSAIRINDTEKKVNIMGNFVAVDGKNDTVSVSNIVNVDGKDETVNISNGNILVDGKTNLIKVKKEVVKEVKEDEIILENIFDSKALSAIISLKKTLEDNLKIEGKIVGEDEVYLHIKCKDKNGEMNVKFSSK
jgi:hypothetical protein